MVESSDEDEEEGRGRREKGKRREESRDEEEQDEGAEEEVSGEEAKARRNVLTVSDRFTVNWLMTHVIEVCYAPVIPTSWRMHASYKESKTHAMVKFLVTQSA